MTGEAAGRPDAAHGALLRARGITHRYGATPVLRGVDVDLEPGEVTALLGPNGSGKTTLMGVLVGLLEPEGGNVTGDRSACGWVPQGGGTYGRLSVRENLRLFAALLRLPGDHAVIAAQAANEAGLTRWLDHAGWQLSGGLRQRLNVAVGLLGDPLVVVLDEPTTGVDLYHRHEMWRVLRQRADAGRAVLYSTHSLEDAAFADRTCMLVDGRVVYAGTLEGIAAFEVPGEHEHVADPVARGMLHLWGSAGGGEG